MWFYYIPAVWFFAFVQSRSRGAENAGVLPAIEQLWLE